MSCISGSEKLIVVNNLHLFVRYSVGLKAPVSSPEI